jgi:hypothetical protein
MCDANNRKGNEMRISAFEYMKKADAMTKHTVDAVSLAKAQINDGGMDDRNAVDAACEQYPHADRRTVELMIAEW